MVLINVFILDLAQMVEPIGLGPGIKSGIDQPCNVEWVKTQINSLKPNQDLNQPLTQLDLVLSSRCLNN